MQALDAKAKAAGVVVLNEMGLDPGMDHMSAQKVIDEVQSDGGHITSFSSLCGGLPAPEAANNPLMYKFSWSPLGVLRASQNSSRYMEGGDTVTIDLEKGVVFNQRSGNRFQATQLPSVMIDILNAGGLVAYLREHGTYQLKEE